MHIWLHKSDPNPPTNLCVRRLVWCLLYSSLTIKCSVAHVCASSRPPCGRWLIEKHNYHRFWECQSILQLFNIISLCTSSAKVASRFKFCIHHQPSCQQTDLLPVAVSSFQHVEGDPACIYRTVCNTIINPIWDQCSQPKTKVGQTIWGPSHCSALLRRTHAPRRPCLLINILKR